VDLYDAERASSWITLEMPLGSGADRKRPRR
jgi:hypothetical protein